VGQSSAELATKIDQLESACEPAVHAVFQAIGQLITPPPTPKRRSGYLRTDA
jgi:hypothetical protein